MDSVRECEVENPLAVSDGNFSSIVAASHELKSPLALIRQLSLALLDDCLDDCSRQKITNQINLTSERAIRLTSDLTKTARLADAMFELEPVNPFKLCDDVATELKPLYRAHQRDIKVRANRLARKTLLIANRDLLRRVMVNFSDNALSYTKKDTTVEIKINLIEAGDVVRLSVRDYGPVLSNDIMKSLKKVNLSQAPISNRPQSSGLGIYIANKFADAMNGKIGMIRHHDGASFFIDLHVSRQLSLL